MLGLLFTFYKTKKSTLNRRYQFTIKCDSEERKSDITFSAFEVNVKYLCMIFLVISISIFKYENEVKVFFYERIYIDNRKK